MLVEAGNANALRRLPFAWRIAAVCFVVASASICAAEMLAH
jgi:hypothetical protein